MTTLDPKTLLDSFYALLATNSGAAAVAVRAALGAGAASVISADDLTVESLPARPFVALRGGPIAGLPAWDAQRMTAIWWLYDDWGSYKFTRVDALIGLIDAAIPADTPDIITYTEIRRIAATAPIRDAALGNRPARSLAYRISWR